MLNFIRKKLSGNSVKQRIIFSTLLFLTLFFSVAVISYYLLPDGFLKGKNPLQNWQTSANNFVLTLQIFFYNMLSVLMIFFGSLFGRKKEKEANYLSLGYLAFYVQICINGVVLGTWSFAAADTAVPLIARITHSFDLVHKAGLWEMMGQLLITCAVAHIATVLTNGKETVTRKIKDVHLTTAEKIALTAGFALMLAGAIIESIAINSL